jgi:hypothetical protein
MIEDLFELMKHKKKCWPPTSFVFVMVKCS